MMEVEGIEVNVFKWKKIINEDWGERVELHNVSDLSDGDVTWGVVSLNIFTSIKLWVNEYKNICGLAEGILKKVGSSEKSFISISDTQLLRKMLNLTNSQWATLCDLVLQSNGNLEMKTLKEVNLKECSSLEKLWFLLCNRRHIMKIQTMLVKLNGGIKCLRQFTVVPKLIVLEIRNEEGKEIT